VDEKVSGGAGEVIEEIDERVAGHKGIMYPDALCLGRS
jgi:hypothetical protein